MTRLDYIRSLLAREIRARSARYNAFANREIGQDWKQAHRAFGASNALAALAADITAGKLDAAIAPKQTMLEFQGGENDE